jgi:hypothetical protein
LALGQHGDLDIAVRLVACALPVEHEAQILASSQYCARCSPVKAVVRRSSAMDSSDIAAEPRKLNTGLPMPRVTPLSTAILGEPPSASQESAPEASAGIAREQQAGAKAGA